MRSFDLSSVRSSDYSFVRSLVLKLLHVGPSPRLVVRLPAVLCFCFNSYKKHTSSTKIPSSRDRSLKGVCAFAFFSVDWFWCCRCFGLFGLMAVPEVLQILEVVGVLAVLGIIGVLGVLGVLGISWGS